jgi:L-asparaginase II
VPQPQRLDIVVSVRRGSLVESRHRIQAAWCDTSGRLVGGTREPDLVTTLRSSAKPFQLLPLVERGHADRWGFTDEQLAVMTASHTGTAYHVALVQGILDRIGLDAGALACGWHEPFDPETAEIVRRDPSLRTPLQHNCSGKHAGMLALALSEGWPTRGYELGAHPLQQLMRLTVAEMAGLRPGDLGVAVDGCGVSVFSMPLSAMATAWARFSAAVPGTADLRERALARIRGAMTGFPRATGGLDRFSTELMAVTGGRLVSKVGAEGLECLAAPERRWGFAIKCEDGNSRAVPPAAIALLDHLGLLPAAERERLGAHARPLLRNQAGSEVGAIEAALVPPPPRS